MALRGTHCAHADAIACAVQVACAVVRLSTNTVYTPLGAGAVRVFATRIDTGPLNASAAIIAVKVVIAIFGFETTTAIELTGLSPPTGVVIAATLSTKAIDADVLTTLIVAHAGTTICAGLSGQVTRESVGAARIVDASVAAHAVLT